jgi:glycosyltransferase involved in cell wall biosynthesis
VRILFLTHYFVPENNAPAARVHSMAREWVRAGHEVTVVTGVPNVPSGVAYTGYRNRPYQREWIDGINVVRVWTYLAANQGTLRRSANFLSYLVTGTVGALVSGDADIVVGTSPQFFAAWAGLAAARVKGRPFVLEVRDIWPESITTVGALRTGSVTRALEWLERRLYRWSPLIVTVSDGLRDLIAAKGVPADKIKVITNGVLAEEFAPRAADAAVRRAWGVRDDQFVCLYAGTIGMAHDLHVVIRAARLLKQEGRRDIAFVLVGDGALRRELENEARRDGLDGVIFTGLQPRARVPDLIAAADACLVNLRQSELFDSALPSKLLEDAAMAKPVVIGFRGYAERLAREAEFGVSFAPGDERGLVAALEGLAADPGLAQRLGANGRAYVLANFDRRALAADYLRLLVQAAEGTGTTPT